ncbi:MAG TPA: adenylate/guanylate cyclase domain-containing protein, partial [Armatimonadota bacterium]|nr:adenylate/guanylate cyclase domain-containing protein [Armatimonadota bacterium]
MDQAPPTGVVTLVFTDIEGSSELSEQYRRAFEPARQEHFRILREAAKRWRGVEVKSVGDSLFVVFARASDAVQWSVDAQRELEGREWSVTASDSPGSASEIPVNLRVRIGMHTGEPLMSEANAPLDYFGPPVNRAARVEAAGHGGQILVSDSTYALALPEVDPSVTFHNFGVRRLKGVGEERLWQVCHPELSSRFPEIRTLSSDNHNLPMPATPFIGREEEIERWRAILLTPAVRLLTLTGFGGMGKTRSALHLAETCAADFPDGVWWVELDDARSGEQMIQRIAYGLRLLLQPEPSGKEQLLAFLSGRKSLLILDNTEQIPDAGRVVKELLNAAPGVRFVVTSRRDLQLQSERVVEVEPLPAADAVLLFEERARARSAGFTITPDNSRDVSELCRRLEGVPLAIELAATRVAGMSPREILDRLTDRFRLLRVRSPDLPDRQSALSGAIDWSYELLDPENQAVFAQLAVFSGGFSMESAEAICDAFDVFESILELRHQSLLRAELDPDSQQTRYSMLESLAEYAAQKLKAFPDGGDAMRHAHLQWFDRFAGARLPKMRSRDERRALLELEVEVDNLRAAVDWAVKHRDVDACAALSQALFYTLNHHGLWPEAERVLRSCWELMGGSDGHRSIRVTVSRLLADVSHDLSRLEEARRWGGASLDLSREENDDESAGQALNVLGVIAMGDGDADTAQRQFEEALERLSEQSHAGRGRALNNLAILARRRGDAETARRLYAEAFEHFREAGDCRQEALIQGNLGVLA